MAGRQGGGEEPRKQQGARRRWLRGGVVAASRNEASEWPEWAALITGEVQAPCHMATEKFAQSSSSFVWTMVAAGRIGKIHVKPRWSLMDLP